MTAYTGKCTPNQCDWTVSIDNITPLPPRNDLLNHSPCGFAWGYGGSGPAQLALAMLAHATDDQAALDWHQHYKRDVIVHLGKDAPFRIEQSDVIAWVHDKRNH